MSTGSNAALSQPESFGKKFRQLAVGALFALVLLIPKILHVRRNPSSWMLFRVFLGISGAALVLLPLGFGTSFVPAIVGLAMFLSSILLPPARIDTHVADKTRRLGALVVVNGGRFDLGEGASFPAQLFVGEENISVRGSNLESLLEIPLSYTTSLQADDPNSRWSLRVNWANKTAAFAYGGVCAEHLARVAETTIRGVMRPALPVLAQRRAAGA